MKRKISPRQREALNLVAEGGFYPTLVEEGDGWHARWAPLGNPWVDAYVRKAAITPLSADAENERHETLHDAWLMALRSRTGLVRWAAEECRAFSAELKDWAGAAEEDVEARKALAFRLEMPYLKVNRPKGLREYRALGQAVYLWGGLRGLRSVQGARDLQVELSAGEAEDFLRRGARALSNAGYSVKDADLSASITATAHLDNPDSPATPGQPGHTLHTPITPSISVKIAGETVTRQEVKFLLDQESSLVFFRDRWIEIDREVLKSALKALEKGPGKKQDLLSFAMGIAHVDRLEIDELKAHGWVRGLIEELKRKKIIGRVRVPSRTAKFRGTLRDYQKRGVAWLSFMTSHGFGALLADDMGLGKTIETIAYLAGDVKNRMPCLIVTPKTLVANWQHELRRFAPSLEEEVTIVNFSRLVRDYDSLSSVEWKTLVIDEAQFIKNAGTQAARAVRGLSPKNRICLTGTPIENSLEDLWSLEDYLNPGFLGDLKDFRKRFVKPIAFDPASAMGAKLKRALEPFVLRRLKSDPVIAAEIGEKRITREYCTLDKKARGEYEAALAAYKVTERSKGDALALLTQLKQICDCEAKVERLLELLETIFERGESALVFTQYTRVGAELKRLMDKKFNTDFPYLHGQLPAKEREREIERFNRGARIADYGLRPSAFILSLRAAGFGLNLTKATHVIHFDRWWNPAVENQATDRVHRIGQDKNVWVHLMITSATLEEKIDKLLDDKENLQGLIADGEAFYNAVRLDE